MRRPPLSTLKAVAQIVYDKKGFNILALDIEGLSNITDYLLIAEGNVDRHISSMGHAIVKGLEEQGEKPLRTEGLKTGDWAVLDYGEITIHLFSPGLRERYCLERLWEEGKLVDLDIDVSKKVSNQ